MRTILRQSFIVAFVVGTSAVQAAGPEVVKSAPLTPQIRVDGVITDWTVLTSLTKEVSVAAANNHERLVIAVATSDASVKQRLLVSGLILYLDAKGKKSKTFGVRIPPPGGGVGAPGRFGNRGGQPPDPGGSPPARDPSVQQPAVTYVEVLGPAEKESHIVDLAGRTGLEVVQGDNQGTLLIEVAIPLRTSDGIAFAAPVDPSQKTIGFGLVTPDISSQGRGRPGEGGRGGGRPGGGGMGGGMGRGGGFGPPPDGGRGPGGGQAKGLNAWTSIELAPRSG
jgi:hypothetical protein